ncbi:MAG: endolytic transglycosylase MltG, partial [bacterium]|nr:endolytic transglycosylase MltG [bacterium]
KAGMPLQVDSEKWTYQNRGLPPLPIANPGLESILAALYPRESPYWYYLSTPDGKTIFSKNLDEHNVARAKYLKL